MRYHIIFEHLQGHIFFIPLPKHELVIVYDIMGKESYSKVIIMENAGESVYVLDPSGKLEPGAYMIIATSMKKICCKKLIVKEY